MTTPRYSFAIASIGFLASATSALAQSAGCADINGFTSALVAVRVDETISALALDAGETVTISGSSVTHFGGGSDGWYVSDPLSGAPGPFGSAPLSPIFTGTGVAFSQTFVVPDGGMLSFGLSETGPISTDLADVTIMCVVPAAAGGGSQIVILSGLAQQQAITTSLGRNYRTRFAMAGAAPSSNGVFASTKGQDNDVAAWVSMSGRAFWDGYEGEAVDLTFGLDSFVAENTLVGVMLGLNRLSVGDAAGSTTDANAAMIGVYAAQGLAGGLLADGYLAWSRVSYDATGASFDTDRLLAGLALTGSIEQAAGVLQPRARISGAWEDFPMGVAGVVGGNTEQIVAAIGARFDWNTALSGTALRPYVSLDLEYGNSTDTSGTRDEFFAPRIGFGVNGAVGGGMLAANFDIGQTSSNVYDAGIDLNYEFRF